MNLYNFDFHAYNLKNQKYDFFDKGTVLLDFLFCLLYFDSSNYSSSVGSLFSDDFANVSGYTLFDLAPQSSAPL